MKKTLLISILAFALNLNATERLTVAANPVPHAEILQFVKPMLAKEGVDLVIKVFADYIQPNVQVAEKRLDANFYQHKPYLDAFNAGKGTHLVALNAVHIEPCGAYSTKVKKLDDLRQGAIVAIPNDPSNLGRSLQLLHKAKLITLKNPSSILSTAKEIGQNPKKLVFKELEAEMLPRVLGQVDLAIINANYALPAKLNPLTDAIVIESKDSPYANFLVARPDNKDNPSIKKLAAALNSAATKKFIAEKYQGAVFAAF